ncbi:MAG: PilZ domain-containing protein [Thermodesulfobacteriota bacterium]|nr:PilZ domain-containing protein [Thermodesulfobacteriota bacterium]
MTDPKIKILISAEINELLSIDDNFADREGVIILIGKDSAELLELARTKTPDIIFNSPSCEQDERAYCRLLKEDSRISDIPVVAVVDSTKLTDLNHVQDERPADVLFTPINTHLFLASARRVLGLAHRAFPRLQTSLLIHFGTRKDNLHTACAFNLSTGGVFIATGRPPEINETISVQIDLSTAADPILCQGTVTWHNHIEEPSRPEMPVGFGLQFTSLKMDDLFAIRSFIDNLESHSS